MLTPKELKALKLGSEIEADIDKRIRTARAKFLAFAKSQKDIGSGTEWISSGSGTPNMVIKGANGNAQDIIVHDHASVVFKSSEFGQLALGTMVSVGPVWRMIEMPEIVTEGKPITNGGAFFPLPAMGGGLAANESRSTPEDEKLAVLYEDLTKLESELSDTEKPATIAKLELQKAELLEQFFTLTKDPRSKRDWLENLADTVASSYETERFPDGLKFLRRLSTRLKRSNQSEGVDHVQWRIIYADYGLKTDLGDQRARDEAHDSLMEALDAFQKEYPQSPRSAEALCTLGIHNEINDASGMESAIKWYREAAKRFPDTAEGKRATGALVRLDSGKTPIAFTGKTLSGQTFNLKDKRWRGKIVVIHFWETWCADGLDDIQRLSEKFSDDVVFVGCNIESNTQDFKDYLAKHRDVSKWIQLHAPGSMEKSPLAHQLGVPSEPLVIMIDTDGRIVESDVNVHDLERRIVRQLRK